ncbi:MAG: MBL fold metallo-hydrolase [Enterocloster clostridioformis]
MVLIDGGSSSQKKLGNIVLEPYLKSRGISWIDYAVVSHGDSDHINGLVYLLEGIKGHQDRNTGAACDGKGGGGI